VELQSAQHAPGFLSGERLVERAGRMGRQIIENDTDTLGLRVRLKTLLRIAKFSQHEADGRKF
jgi:hypothetical protein